MSSVSWTPSGAPYYNAIQKRLFDRMDTDQNGALDQDEFQASRSRTLLKERPKLYDGADAGQAGSGSRAGVARGYSVAGLGAIGQLSADVLDVLVQLRPQDNGLAGETLRAGTGARAAVARDQGPERMPQAEVTTAVEDVRPVAPAYLGAAALLSNLTAGPGAAYQAFDAGEADPGEIKVATL